MKNSAFSILQYLGGTAAFMVEEGYSGFRQARTYIEPSKRERKVGYGEILRSHFAKQRVK